MKEIIIHLLRNKAGIDKAIAFTLVTRVIQILSAFFTMLYTVKYLTPTEQGYYFTFASLLALQIFFELGLTGIITQFVAHEISHLTWTKNFMLVGNDEYKSRLSSLIHLCIKWYTRIALFLIFVLTFAGLFFFENYNKNDFSINWVLPWILLVIGTSLNFIVAPVSSFLEGLGFVENIAKIRLIQQIISPIIFCVSLSLGIKLYVSSLIAFSSAIIFIYFFFRLSLFKYLLCIWKFKIVEKVSYYTEILPYQWKIAVSWISGYFIFQIFNPVLFASEGADIAGQMGMTITALNALIAMSTSWINTKVPALSGLIALKNYEKLDYLFFKTQKQIIFISTFLISIFICTVYYFQINDISILKSHIGERFLPINSLSIISLALLLQVPINTWAVYLRCHKMEPLLFPSLIGGVSCILSAVILGNKYGLFGLLTGFILIQFALLIWIYFIFKNKRLLWHTN